MPPQPKTIEFPSWVEAIEDDGLSSAVREALLARNVAVRFGVEQASAPIRKAFDAADETLDAVADGVVKGAAARKKASVAIRKYTEVAEQLMAVP